MVKDERFNMTNSDHLSDTELLLAYGRDGEETAFETLARRHVDMIFSVSLRRSNNRQLAEEATQNVLLGLSRNAAKLAGPERNLAGWLHKSTHFEVSKLKRREARIKTRERAYANHDMNASTRSEDEEFQRLYPILDQAIDSLQAPDREVIVRRYLEGQNFRRIGDSLGISEDAAQKRASRAFDRLNAFFRKRAGITVSSAVLAAGISRNCAEAAPASCLNILGQTAATGTASGLSTTIITAMSTGKIAAIAAGVVILGGAVTYIATRDDSPTGIVSSPPPETASPPRSSAGEETSALAKTTERPVAAVAGDAPDYSPNKELARLEAMSPHPGKDEFARRLAVKHDQLLKDLADDLGLGTAQVASVKEALDVRLEAFRAALETGPQPGDPEPEALRKEQAMIVRAGEIIRGAGLRDDLVGVLSAEQLASFDQRETDAWQSQVESHAYTEFSKIAPVLALTEEQKDRVFELLQASSDEILRADAAERAYVAMRMGQAAATMDLPDPVEMRFIIEAFEGPNPPDPESPGFRERLIEVVGGRIDKRVELLAPVLDERQTQRYRDHLTQQSVLSIPSAQRPDSE
jgi:RNA polymerase sigma factor (sigma-70 family)